ncbi:MAG: glycosyltransferase [Ignavibacteria bacterium]
MDLSIIIVNYNVKEFIQNLLHSIFKAGCNLKYEIIIIDNASDDGSADFIKEKFPNINLISNKKNLGFGKANNIGLAAAKGKYILLINPDTLIREDTLEKMISFFESSPDAGLAGCKILNPDGSLQLACRRSFPGPWTSFCKVTGLSSLFPHSRLFARYNLTYLDENRTYEVDAISGSFMMMKKEVYEKIGGFDEQFFMYGEDLDLCYRIQKAGWKVYYTPDTQIIHYKGESTRRSSLDETKIFYDAMNLFVKKHLSSSILVETILKTAIGFRKFFAFMARKRLIFISVIMDFFVFNASMFLAEQVYKVFSTWSGFPIKSLLLVYTIPALMHILTAGLAGSYKKDSISVLKNFGAIILGFFVISSLTYFFKQYAYSRAVVIITYFILLFTLTGWRVIFKLLFRFGIKENEPASRNTLIIGTNSAAVSIANKLKIKKNDYHAVYGFISASHADIGKKLNGYEIVGSLENLNKVIKERKIQEVIFSTEELSYYDIMAIVSANQTEDVEFKLIDTNLDFIVGKTSVTMLDDMPIIDITNNISRPLFKFIKAVFDYSIALIVLFFIYPFIYFIVKLTGKRNDFRDFVLNVPLIFSGKTSFVGPCENSARDNLYLGKQGLTGFWYIENMEGGDRKKLDLYYAKNQNIWLDMEILGKTINKMWSKH